jgi:hypothetical protein
MTRAVAANDVIQLADAEGLTHQQADHILDLVYMQVVCEQEDVDGLGAVLKQHSSGTGMMMATDQEWHRLAQVAAAVLGAAGM